MDKDSKNIKNNKLAQDKQVKKAVKSQAKTAEMPASGKTMVVPKAETGKVKINNQNTNKVLSIREKIFPEKFFNHEEKPKNFGLSIAVTTVRLFAVFMFVGIIAAVGALLGVASAYVETSPAVNSAVLTDLSKTSLIYDANGKEISKYTGVENRVWVKLEEMPENLKDAFVSIEDTRFYSHEGIDYKRLFGAFVGNLQSSSVQGGSTISQQLVKIRMLTSERSYKRKIQEAYMTMDLEKNYSKDQILETYMNTILLGGSNYGVEAAANDYFGKSVKDLTLRECAMLGGITQSPNKYNPRTNYFTKNTPNVIDDRTNLVLQSMYAAGRISHEELTTALEEKAQVQKTSSFKTDKLQYAYFVEYAITDIIDNLIVQRGLEDTKTVRNNIENELRTQGYSIHLTIDSDIQNTVQDTLSEWKSYPRVRKASDAYSTEVIGNDTIKHPQPEAAAVVYDYRNGEYKAIVGGRNLPTAEKIQNRASDKGNGVGSSIKPITVYGPALDMGLNPNSMISNEASRIPGWNTAKGYPAGSGPSGMVTVRSAIVSSMNRAASRLLMTKVGVDTAAQYLIDMGVPESRLETQRTGSALALGSVSISPMEMSTSFGTIANSGTYIKPISFTKVVDGSGKVILDGKVIQENSKKQIYKKSTAYFLTSMLEDAVSSGTGRNAKISGMATAGKTGTNETKNVSFSGYTPYYSATVYIGHDKNKDLANVFAGSYAAPLWKSFMTKIHKGLPNKKIIDDGNMDLGINEIRICAVTGLKATDACSHDIQGKVPTASSAVQENLPQGTCDAHHIVTICEDTHKTAKTGCPSQVTIAVLRKTDKISVEYVNEYLNVIKEQYPNFDTGTACPKHRNTTKPTTAEATEATTATPTTFPPITKPSAKPTTAKPTTKPTTPTTKK